MEFIFISPRLMLRHKDEGKELVAFLHIPFPIPYSRAAALLRLSLLLLQEQRGKKMGTSTFMSVGPFDTHLWHCASQFSFHLCIYAKYYRDSNDTLTLYSYRIKMDENGAQESHIDFYAHFDILEE